MPIPKILHYCWLSSDPFPKKVQDCIDSWKKHLPDWELWLWNTERFDVNATAFTKNAFERREWASVSDYIRFYALYHHGGVYLDCDVEVLKSFDDLVDYDCFIGYEYSGMPEAAVLGCIPQLEWVKTALAWYEKNTFLHKDGTINRVVAPIILKSAYEQHYAIRLLDEQCVYAHENNIVLPSEYLSPKNGYTGIVTPTKNTYCIHHFSASWKKNTLKNRLNKRLHQFVRIMLGVKNFNRLMYRLRAKKQAKDFCLLEEV